MAGIKDLYPVDPDARIASQLAEAAITNGEIEDLGATPRYPLDKMDKSTRFISSLLRIDKHPNSVMAREALKALVDMGVVREIGSHLKVSMNRDPADYDVIDREYAGL